MKKPYKSCWILIFIFALAAGLIIRDLHTSKFAVIKNSSALAPTPVIEDTYPEESGEEEEYEKDGLININTAPVSVLTKLDGIGEKMAQRIVDYRIENGPFETIQDIMKVSGIGEKRFKVIKSHITVE